MNIVKTCYTLKKPIPEEHKSSIEKLKQLTEQKQQTQMNEGRAKQIYKPEIYTPATLEFQREINESLDEISRVLTFEQEKPTNQKINNFEQFKY